MEQHYHPLPSSAAAAVTSKAIETLRKELVVVTNQLRAAKQEIVQLRQQQEESIEMEARRSASEAIDSIRRQRSQGHHQQQHQREVTRNDQPMSPSTVYRYVPPHEFLPKVFLEEYFDVLEIVDRYAQLYHKHHLDQTAEEVADDALHHHELLLGGGGTRSTSERSSWQKFQVDSTASELEMVKERNARLQRDAFERDKKIERLEQELAIWKQRDVKVGEQQRFRSARASDRGEKSETDGHYRSAGGRRHRRSTSPGTTAHGTANQTTQPTAAQANAASIWDGFRPDSEAEEQEDRKWRRSHPRSTVPLVIPPAVAERFMAEGEQRRGLERRTIVRPWAELGLGSLEMSPPKEEKTVQTSLRGTPVPTAAKGDQTTGRPVPAYDFEEAEVLESHASAHAARTPSDRAVKASPPPAQPLDDDEAKPPPVASSKTSKWDIPPVKPKPVRPDSTNEETQDDETRPTSSDTIRSLAKGDPKRLDIVDRL